MVDQTLVDRVGNTDVSFSFYFIKIAKKQMVFLTEKYNNHLSKMLPMRRCPCHIEHNMHKLTMLTTIHSEPEYNSDKHRRNWGRNQ